MRHVLHLASWGLLGHGHWNVNRVLRVVWVDDVDWHVVGTGLQVSSWVQSDGAVWVDGRPILDARTWLVLGALWEVLVVFFLRSWRDGLFAAWGVDRIVLRLVLLLVGHWRRGRLTDSDGDLVDDLAVLVLDLNGDGVARLSVWRRREFDLAVVRVQGCGAVSIATHNLNGRTVRDWATGVRDGDRLVSWGFSVCPSWSFDGFACDRDSCLNNFIQSTWVRNPHWNSDLVAWLGVSRHWDR